MAIKKNITLKDNFNENVYFADAYIKVENISGDKSRISYTYGIYKTAGGDLLKRFTKSFVPDMDGGNFIKQAYMELKSVEFVGSADV